MKIRDELNQTIFLSYSHDDIDIVKKIEKELSKYYDVWVDYSEIHAKENFNDKIAQGIENCDLFISIISNSYISKDFCQQELTHAQKHNKERMPLYIENVALPSQINFIFNEWESELRVNSSYKDANDLNSFINEIVDNLLTHLEKYFTLFKLRETGKKIELKNLNIDFEEINYNFNIASKNGYFEKNIYKNLYPYFEDTTEKNYSISFHNINSKKGTCLADLSIKTQENENYKIKNILVKNTINNDISVCINESIDDWGNNYLSINDLKKTIIREYKNFQIHSHNKDNNQKLIDYIENNKDRHIVIYGEGGSGKTVAVKKIYEHFYSKETPILYVPINKIRFGAEDVTIEKYIKDIIAGSKNWSILRKLATTSIYDKRVILILDGYNEITESIIKAANQISEIMQWKNIQVIITSRYNCTNSFNTDNINTLNFLPLDESQVIEHLNNKGIDASLISKKLINLISNPLMLTLFAESDIDEIYSAIQSRKSLYYYYNLEVSKSPNTQGKIIYNYLISQLYKKVKENTNSLLDCFFAVEYALPLLAFFIIKKDESFQIEKANFEKYLTAALNKSEISGNYLNNRFVSIQTNIGNNDNDFFKNCVPRIVNCILNELSLVSERDGQLEFEHQTLRDFFAAIFLSKQIEALVPNNSNDELIDSFFSSGSDLRFEKEVLSIKLYSEDVLGFCSTILKEENAKPIILQNNIDYPGKSKPLDASNHSCAEKVLSVYRNDESIKAQNSVANLIGIMVKARNKDLSNCDFSNLDLRKSDLSHIQFTNWIDNNIYPSSFENAIIDRECFIKPGHHSQIAAIYVHPEKAVYSIDVDGIINVWNLTSTKPIKSYFVKIDSNIIDLSVNSDASIIAVLTHQTLYLYDTINNSTEIITTTHYYKKVRFNKEKIEVTYDVKPLIWKDINEEYAFDDVFDFPANVSVLSPNKEFFIKSANISNTDTEIRKFSTDMQNDLNDFQTYLFKDEYSIQKCKIRSGDISPNSKLIALCFTKHVVILDANTMLELHRASYGTNIQNVKFIDNNTLAISNGPYLMILDTELNTISISDACLISRILQSFHYNNNYWVFFANGDCVKFDKNMNIDKKRKPSIRINKNTSPGKDLVSNQLRFFILNNDECSMYDFYHDEYESAITNYYIENNIEKNSLLFPYQIYLIGGNTLKIIERKNPSNIRLYKNYGVFNIFKCNFHNVKGNIINYLDIIQQEGGKLNERNEQIL